MTLRFNHMELTLPPGALDDVTRSEIARFYGEVFGWNSLDVPILGQKALLLRSDEETSQFLLIAESKKPVSVPGYDHLGLLLETRAQVDGALAAIRAWRARDERVQIKEYEDLEQGDVTVHAFYVRYLLPIWFDVQCMEWKPGAEPARRWSYA
jgi:hypothetical protein